MVKKKGEEDTTYPVRLFCRKCEEYWIEEVDRGTYAVSYTHLTLPTN